MSISRKNHWAKNLITRGNMNISAITKGFILPSFKFIIRRKGGGSPQYGEGIDHLKTELKKLTGKTYDDVELIEVYVDWNKEVEKHSKEVYVELIQKKIEVQLLKSIKEKYKIKVELIKKKN